VRIAFDHHRRAPAAQPLQLMRRRAHLTMPRGAGVPQIVPAEVLDTSTLQRSNQRVGTPRGLPRYLNTRTECLHSCRRNTSSAVALSGTAICLRFFDCTVRGSRIPSGLSATEHAIHFCRRTRTSINSSNTLFARSVPPKASTRPPRSRRCAAGGEY